MEILTLRSLKGLANTYIVKNNKQCIIIDCGVTIGAVKDIVKDCKVLGVFLTHGHFDHITYISEYLNEFNCEVYCSSKCFEKLSNPNKNLSKNFLQNGISINLNEYNNLDNIENIELAGLDIKILWLPGHSECSLGYVIQNNIFCGDVLFSNAVGRTDFYDGNADKLKESINKIKSLSPVNVYCGHGENFAF